MSPDDLKIKDEIADILREEMKNKGPEDFSEQNFPNTWRKPWEYQENGWMSATDITERINERRKECAERTRPRGVYEEANRGHVRYWLSKYSRQRNAFKVTIRKKSGEQGSPSFEIYKWNSDHPLRDIERRIRETIGLALDAGSTLSKLDDKEKRQSLSDSDLKLAEAYQQIIQTELFVIMVQIAKMFGPPFVPYPGFTTEYEHVIKSTTGNGQ